MERLDSLTEALRILATHGKDYIKDTAASLYADAAAAQAEVARLQAERGELVETINAFIGLWPVLPDRSEPKATPEVIAAWRQARALLARLGGETDVKNP